ncbi:MAG: ABC transporter permease [Lachnospiraceae bacterium]|nr:ABC transporter permease [Lachnospiraceae bacterium]
MTDSFGLKMLSFFSKLGWKKLILWVLNICAVTALIILTIVLQAGRNSLPEQLLAKRWADNKGVSQISLFLSEDLLVDRQNVKQIRYTLEKSLESQSITPESPSARLYVDAYASFGELSLKGPKKSMSVTAIGTGGDFFLFHPVELTGGNYFSENDVMQDVVLLDEETAWQLYGATDIVGKDVEIAGEPYRVAGVYKREQGKLETMAGSSGVTVFLPYERLETLQDGTGIAVYEILMPNPVKGFAVEELKKCVTYEESDSIMIENTTRFGYEALYRLFKTRANRTMRTDDIILPYWENLARVKEEKLMETALLQVMLAAGLFVYWFVMLMRFVVTHKPTKQTFERIGDYIKTFTRKRKKVKGEDVQNEEVRF